jgi:hypothetical protein
MANLRTEISSSLNVLTSGYDRTLISNAEQDLGDASLYDIGLNETEHL